MMKTAGFQMRLNGAKGFCTDAYNVKKRIENLTDFFSHCEIDSRRTKVVGIV